MANIIEQNPGSTEIQSPLIAGLSEGLTKISKALDMVIATATNIRLEPVAIDDKPENKNRIFEVPFGRKLWLKSPIPVIKKNGIILQQTEIPYVIDYVGGSITFPPNKILDGDTITADFSYITTDSNTLNGKQNMAEGMGLYPVTGVEYTQSEKTELSSLIALSILQNLNAIATAVNGKVDKEVGKVLSSNDFTNEDVEMLTNALNTSNANSTAISELTNNKVDKELGKGLYPTTGVEFTPEEKTKLSTLNNYDDTEIKSEIAQKANARKSYTLLIPVVGWSDIAPYTQRIDVQGMVADGLPLYDLIEFSEQSMEDYAMLTKLETFENAVEVTANFEKPVGDIKIRIEVVY